MASKQSSPAALGTGDGAAGTADRTSAGDLRGVVEELYQLEPSRFVAVRTSRVAEARVRGDRDLAKHIGKLPRPSKAAWMLNLLVHRRPDGVERLLELAESLRDATERLAGSELRELGATRRRLIAELTDAAGTLAAESGTSLSEPMLEEIRESLQAAIVDEDAARAVASGYLAKSLQIASVGGVDLSGALPPVPLARPAGPAKAASAKPPVSAAPVKAAPVKAAPVKAAPVRAAAARLHQAEEMARQAGAAVKAARKDVEQARRARERARARRESAEAELASSRSLELASSSTLIAAEGAERRAQSAFEVAERARHQAAERAK